MKNFIKYQILKSLLLILFLSTLSPANSLEIILDDQNPIQFFFPNSNQIMKIDLRFYFLKDSQGLTYRQYIGLAFPNSLASELNFDKGIVPKYNCLLMELSKGKVYKMTAEKPSASEPNYIYCKFDDRINNILKTGNEFYYKLTVELIGFKIISTNYIKNFMIFTSTSNDANKIIIDHSINFGTQFIYPNWEENRTNSFELVNQSILQGNNPITNLYPYQTFDIALILKSNVFIASSDIIINIKLPIDLITYPESVVSNSDKTNPALKGNISISRFSNNFIIIKGIEDSFIPGKLFNLTLKGITTKDLLFNLGKPIEIFIFYKNTYSVLSYAKTNESFIKVNNLKIQLSANHPESWDIWRNSLWPMNFKITNGSNPLKNGGFIVLQHSNAIDNEIKWNFVASTCDFSDTENFDNGFGKRPVCYPLRTDFEYVNSSGGSYGGSAIFFKINSISPNQTINLTVWGSADNCGGNKIDNLSTAIKLNQAFRQFNYKVFIYTGINQFATNENRFFGNNISLIAQSDEITMANKCFNNINNGIDFLNVTPIAAAGGAGRVFLNNEFLKKNILYDKNDSDKKALKDLNLFREFYNFELSVETASILPCDSCHLADVTKDSNDFNNGFIYGTKSVNTPNSYFSLRLPILHYTKDANGNKIAQNLAIPAEYLPVNFAYDSTGSPGNFPGRLQFLFSKKWFILGNQPSCYMSWGMYSPDIISINKDKSLIVNDSTGQTNSNYNWITSNTTNLQAWMDTLNTCLSVNSCNNIRIISKHHTGKVSTSNQFNNFQDIATNLYDENKNDSFFTFYVYYFSSCLKWANLPIIKSLYTYIDFQVQWLYSVDPNKIGLPSRNLRMIKLFPEAGVFNDNISENYKFLSKTNSPFIPTQINEKTYYLHYALGSGSNMTGICLIEISGKNIMDLFTDKTTHLGIWIGFGVLLETDYNDIASYYPMTPIDISKNYIYAFQSAYLLNSQESMLFSVNSIFKEDNDFSKNTFIFRSLLQNYAKVGVTSTPSNYDLNPKDAPDQTGNIFDKFSSYYFLMGSFILISKNNQTPMISMVGNETQLRNILIPIYCPIKNTKIYFGNGLPTLFISTINMKAFNEISNIEKIMTVNINNTEAKDDKALFSVILTSIYSSNPELYRSDQTIANSLDNSTSNFKKNLINIRWAPYTASSPDNYDNYIYLFLGTKDIKNPSSGICTGHVFLLHDSLEVNNNLLKSNFPGLVNYNQKQKKFYFLGKEFNHSIYIGLQNASYPTSNNIITSNNSFFSENSSMYLIGIKRPLISYYYVNNQFIQAYDKIGYFCSDLKNKDNYTNYLYNADISTKIFVVDYNFPSQEPNKFNLTINADKTETIYKNDIAGNIKITGTIPGMINLQPGSSINFSFSGSVINSSSLCGLYDQENMASDCTFTNNIVSCLVPKILNNFYICCYNISYLGIITSDTIVLNSLNISVPPYPASFADYYTDKIFTEQNPARFTWKTSHSSAQDVISFNSVTISNLEYTHVLQDSGIGKVNFTLTLPREPTRNMIITFYADLSAMYLPNSVPRCTVAFGYGLNLTSENSGDLLLDTCDVSNLGSSINSIKITTKNIIYKCGLTFSKSLNVFIWPILTINFTTSPYNALNYKILMNLKNENSDAIVKNTSSFTIKDTQIYPSTPLLMNQWQTLCPLISIDPKIPGEVADYVFEINIDTYRIYLINSIPNEFSLFFPFNYYGSNFNNINCYDSTNNYYLNCAFTSDSILNIRLPLNLQIGSGKKLQIKITGIVNPSININENVYFICTLNKTDFSNNSRINLITGSGIFSGGITLPNSSGNLRFLYVSNPISDLNPRNTSTLIFKLGFDLIGGLTNFPITISNYPRLIINFPSEYKFAWYDNTKISATINEYNIDDKNLNLISSSIIPKYIQQSGNKLTLFFDLVSYTFKSSFQNWEITLNNIINPPEQSSQEFLALRLGCKFFRFILTNSDFTSVFKTNTNTYNLVLNNLDNQLDPWLTNYKGFSFTFDNKKWVIDIGTNEKLNKLTVKAGRFIESKFNLRNNSNLYADSTVISLIDSTFKLFQQSYSVNTSSKDPTPFMIGAPCGSPTGNYIVNFISSDPINFRPLSPVIVTLTNTFPGTLSYLNPPTIPAAGSTLIYFYISEPNFDPLKLYFYNDDNFKNDPTTDLTSVLVPAATITEVGKQSPLFGKFSIKNNQIQTPQVFKLTNPNACYSWIQKSLTIYISGFISVFPKNINIYQSFKYYNYDTDSTLQGKNTIKFTIYPQVIPSYFSCALVCIDSKYPEEEDIRNSKGVVSPLLKFYKTMIVKSNPLDIIFDNLIRGQKYKLRCLIDSIEGEIFQRKSIGTFMDSYIYDNGTTVPIKTLPQIKPQCVQYIFNNEPSLDLKSNMMNFCQNIFMKNSTWELNGCIVCTDSNISVFPSGFNLPKSLDCSRIDPKIQYSNPNNNLSGARLLLSEYNSFENKDIQKKTFGFLYEEKIKTDAKEFRILQNNSTNPSSIQNNTNGINAIKSYYLYSICPVPYQVCTSDISNGNNYENYFKQLLDSFNSDENIKKNINNPDSNLSLNKTVIIKDEIKPDISKMMISIISSNMNGLVKWTSNYSSPLLCYWQISDLVSIFTADSIAKCTDLTYCGQFRVTVFNMTSSTNEKYLQPLNEGSQFGLFIVCYNDIPYANLQSNIKIVNFTIERQRQDDNINSKSNNTPIDVVSSEYLQISLILFIYFILLI